jgi:hypothetical protein
MGETSIETTHIARQAPGILGEIQRMVQEKRKITEENSICEIE